MALHFANTAEAVNSMTDSYRRVHEELRKGARQLCEDSDSIESLSLLDQSDAQAVVAEQASPTMVRAPKDYAPKDATDATGTLDERYGLQEENGSQEENISQPVYDIPVAPDK